MDSKMKTRNDFILGLIMGVVVMLVLYFFVFAKNENKPFRYVQLKEDYKIENVGTLKKGIVLRTDEGMSEGFTRYILYLNLKGGNTEIYRIEHPDEIIPYWLQPIDTTK